MLWRISWIKILICFILLLGRVVMLDLPWASRKLGRCVFLSVVSYSPFSYLVTWSGGTNFCFRAVIIVDENNWSPFVCPSVEWLQARGTRGQVCCLRSTSVFALSLWFRCDAETQKIITSLTYQDLITTQNGMTISRALVNVVIDQQIGQQISVRLIFRFFSVYWPSQYRWTRLARFCSTDVVHSAAPMM